METRILKLERMLEEGMLPRFPSQLAGDGNLPKSLIEQVIDDNTVQKKQKEKAITLSSIQDTFQTSAQAIGIDLSSFTRVVKFAIEFVGDNALAIGQLVGSTITGSIRFDLACKLVGSLFSEIAMELIGQSVQTTFDLTKREKQLQLEINKSQVLDLPKKNLLEEPTPPPNSPKRRTRRCVIN